MALLFEAPLGDSVVFPGSRQAKPSVRREMATASARRAPKNPAARPKGDNSPVVFPGPALAGRSCSRRQGRRSQGSDSLNDRGEQFARDCDLRHLKRDVPAVADDLRTDLDQLLAQGRQRPLGNRLRLQTGDLFARRTPGVRASRPRRRSCSRQADCRRAAGSCRYSLSPSYSRRITYASSRIVYVPELVANIEGRAASSPVKPEPKPTGA
jgi:hypothetical protein